MPTANITRAKYDAMLASYRAEPGRQAEAARAAGVTRQTATKAWKVGWPALGWLSIQRVLELEQVEARAYRHEENARALEAGAEVKAAETLKLAEAEAATRLLSADAQVAAKLSSAVEGAKREVARVIDAAKLDAVETTRQEARISQNVRQAALAVQTVAAIIFQPAVIKAIGESIQQSLTKKALSTRELNRLTSFLDKVMDISLKAIVLERKRVGAPETVIQMRSGGDMTLPEMEAKAASIVRAVQRAKDKAAGKVPIIEDDEPEPGGVH